MLSLLLVLIVFVLMIPRPLSSTLFPYTTLFRSSLLSQPWAAGIGLLGYLGGIGVIAVPFVRAGMAKPPREYPTYSAAAAMRSEEHTSELQSRGHLVCRLLLEKKNKAY